MTERKYWFTAKSYGWGWGLPAAWQGWVVLIAFVLLMIAGAILVLPRFGMLLFYAYTFALVAMLTFVCWRTGPPPRWRWGDDD